MYNHCESQASETLSFTQIFFRSSYYGEPVSLYGHVKHRSHTKSSLNLLFMRGSTELQKNNTDYCEQ